MHKKIIYTLVCIIGSTLSFSQPKNPLETKEKITSLFANYFALDRESIHLHINKTDFITSEKIWFKGYVLNRKTNAPSLKTTNVYAVLYDSKGGKIAQKLLFTNNGHFAGNFDVSDNFESGEYYIQTYTNWMNNFSEDESNTRKINVINPNQGKLRLNSSPNSNSVKIEFFPEGTNFIRGISNSVVVKASDCAGNLVKNTEAIITNSNGDVIKNVTINQFGYGKFEITPTTESYKFTLDVDNTKIESFLPVPIVTGFALEVNNYVLNEKTVIKLKTNSQTIQSLNEKLVYVIINQDERVIVHDVKLNTEKLNYELLFSNENLFTGINCIRIIDSNYNLLAERIIYQHLKNEFKSNLMLNIAKNSSLNLVGYSNYPDGNISISILPEETKSLQLNRSIIYDFTCHSYLSEDIPNFDYFLSQKSRAKSFELDLLLISQKTNKYNWNSIQNNPPTEKFTFDIGVKIQGTVNTELKDHNMYKAKIFSISEGLLATTDINEKNQFEFDKLLLTQSSDVSLLTLKMPKLEPIESHIIASVVSKQKPFIKGIALPQNCDLEKEIIPIVSNEMPIFKGKSILLKEVEIDKNELKYKNVFGNRNLTSFKVDESFGIQSLLFFIGSNGFNVNRTIYGDVSISSRKNVTLKGGTERPAVFIDGVQLFENRELSMYTMADVDEIYLSNSYFLGADGTYGMIKIYLKKKNYSYQKNIANSFKIDEGFERYIYYENNSNYLDYDSEGFKNYGVINYIPYTLIEDNGTYYIQTTDSYKGKMKLIIEGITNDGKLIYEEKLFQVK